MLTGPRRPALERLVRVDDVADPAAPLCQMCGIRGCRVAHGARSGWLRRYRAR